MKKMDRKKPKRIKTSHRFWQLAIRRSAKKNRTSVADHSVGNRKSLMVFIRRFVLMICVQKVPISLSNARTFSFGSSIVCEMFAKNVSFGRAQRGARRQYGLQSIRRSQPVLY